MSAEPAGSPSTGQVAPDDTPAQTAASTATRGAFAQLLSSPGFRIAAFSIIAVSGVSGLAYAALQQIIKREIKRTGKESSVNLRLHAPYGALYVFSGTRPGVLAQLEASIPEEESPAMRMRYGLQQNGVGNLLVTIGADEGYMGEPPLAAGTPPAFRASTPNGIALVSANTWRSDDGYAEHYGAKRPPMVLVGGPMGSAAYPPQLASNATARSVADDEGEFRARVHLSREVPFNLDAQLGFGDSYLDLTGLSLATLALETGASRARVKLRSLNPVSMTNCVVSAGVGECSIDGIGYLNTRRFEFGGGLGYYNLGFAGKLVRDMEALISVGLGKVAINIPPDVARVQVFYDDGFFSSFKFNGLAKRAEGYATSAGFDKSTAPILTLRLTSGMGKMVVNYR